MFELEKALTKDMSKWTFSSYRAHHTDGFEFWIANGFFCFEQKDGVGLNLSFIGKIYLYYRLLKAKRAKILEELTNG